MSHRVVITGIGVISPYGTGVQKFWNGLKQGKNALIYNSKLKSVVGCIPDNDDPLKNYSKGQLREMNRSSILAIEASTEALNDAGLINVESGFHDNTSVNIGTCVPDVDSIYDVGVKIQEKNERRISPYFVPRILTNIPASYVSLKYKLRGGNSSTSTACATGASCIADAYLSIKHGLSRRFVAGAVESCVNSIGVEGFRRMRALATSDDVTCSKPFDVDRQGFVLSEGAGIVVLERLEDAEARNANIYAEILGFGTGNDAYHLTAPSNDGYGSTLCMKRCLDNSGINSNQISYVNAHATSTPVGDKAEAHSIAEMKKGITVSSIKGHIGHTLGAAGAVETICTALSVKEGLVIGTNNLNTTDIKADVDLIKAKDSSTIEWKCEDRRIALMNSFGFGGAFVSLCIAEYR